MNTVYLEKRKIHNKIEKYKTNLEDTVIDLYLNSKFYNFKSYFKRKELRITAILYKKNRPTSNVCINFIYKNGLLYIKDKAEHKIELNNIEYIRELITIVETELYKLPITSESIFYKKKRGRQYDIFLDENNFVKVFVVTLLYKRLFLNFLKDTTNLINNSYTDVVWYNLKKTNVNYISSNKLNNLRKGHKGRNYKLFNLNYNR